jgi:argininosuccinate synthase
LHLAIKSLKHLCWDRALQNTARSLGSQYGECIYDGFWHSALKHSLEAFFLQAGETLTGTVTLKLQNGTARVLSRSSNYSLYDMDSVTFEADGQGIHHLANGWCKIASLSQIQQGKRDQKNQGGEES